jgi:hypothetical protein
MKHMGRRLEKSYAHRSVVLSNLGFASYLHYLNSPMWQFVRQKAFKDKGRVCHCCKDAPATQIHHSRYDIRSMNGSCTHDLWPLCAACHHYGEFWPNGAKVNPLRVTQRLVDRSIELCLPKGIDPFWPHKERPKGRSIIASIIQSDDKRAKARANCKTVRKLRKAGRVA